MRLSFSFGALLIAIGIWIEHATASVAVCKNYGEKSKGFDLRADNGRRLCYPNGQRAVNLYEWPGFDKPENLEVKKVTPQEPEPASTKPSVCDHVFELVFLAQYLEQHICPILESGKLKGPNFKTIGKGFLELGELKKIINAPQNLAYIDQSLETNYKTTNVRTFHKLGQLHRNFGAVGEDKERNIGMQVILLPYSVPIPDMFYASSAAMSSYLTQSAADATRTAKQLDDQMANFITKLVADGAKAPPRPDFQAKWKEFVTLMNAQGQLAVKAVEKNTPKDEQTKGGTPKGSTLNPGAASFEAKGAPKDDQSTSKGSTLNPGAVPFGAKGPGAKRNLNRLYWERGIDGEGGYFV